MGKRATGRRADYAIGGLTLKRGIEMNKEFSEVGDTVLEVLEMCSRRENRAILEDAAEQRKITFEQLVAAAMAQRLSEEFVIRRRRTPEPFPSRRRSR